MARNKILLTTALMPFMMKSLEADYEVSRLTAEKDAKQFLKSRGGEFEVLVTSAAKGADRSLIESLPNLKFITVFGVGYETVDLKAVRERNIVLTNTARVLDDCVADTALALVLATHRRLIEADRFVRAGRWLKESFPMGVSLSGKRCGIVGLGNIGGAIARRVEAFGMTISYFARHERPESPYPFFDNLVTMAEAVDLLIVAVSGGPESHHLIDAEVMKALGPNGFIINISRGAVIDEKALIAALEKGELKGAGLDVFEHEPKVPEALLAMEQVVLLPHIASGTTETRNAMGAVVLDNLKNYFDKAPKAYRSVVL